MLWNIGLQKKVRDGRYYWQISSPNVAHGAENLRYQEFQDLAHKNGQNTDDDDDLAIAVFSLTM